MDRITEARTAVNAAIERMNAAADAVEAATDETTAEELDALTAAFSVAETELDRSQASLARLERVASARNDNPLLKIEERITVTKNESTYRPDGEHSFFRDLVKAGEGSWEARERLQANTKEILETRDVDSTDGAGFIPPVYLADRWADIPRAGREFADKLPKFPFPAYGQTLSLPKLTGDVAVGVQTADEQPVTEQDLTTDTVTAKMVTIAGQQDISRQVLDRTLPGLDQVIYNALRELHDSKLDTQLISGTGLNGQHKGIRTVEAVNTVAFASGDQLSLVGAIISGAAKIAQTRFRSPSFVLMSPRRAAWLAAGSSTSQAVLRSDGITLQFGESTGGFAGNISGIPVVLDANVGVNYGGTTSEDEVYLVYAPDLFLSEGPLQQATYNDVLSGTLQVRLQLFSYSFFMGAAQPKAIAVISGAGLNQVLA